MLIHCRELPVFIFCSHHSKTTKEAYLKSFEQGSWLWISATTKKWTKISDVCPTAPGKEKWQWHILHELSTPELLSKKHLCQSTHCPHCLNTWWHSTIHRKLPSLHHLTFYIEKYFNKQGIHLLRHTEIYLSLKYTLLILFDSYKLPTKAFLISVFFFSTPFHKSLFASIYICFLQQQGIKKGWGRESLIVVFKEARQTESLMRKGVESNFKSFRCTL